MKRRMLCQSETINETIGSGEEQRCMMQSRKRLNSNRVEPTITKDTQTSVRTRKSEIGACVQAIELEVDHRSAGQMALKDTRRTAQNREK